MSIDLAKTDDKEYTNMDILRRVSNLEKKVYGKGENESSLEEDKETEE